MNNKQEKSNGVAALLSFLIPGAGQMYKEKVGAGLCWFVFVIAGYMMLFVPGMIFHILCIFNAASSSSGISSDEKNNNNKLTDDQRRALGMEIPNGAIEISEKFVKDIIVSHDLFKRGMITRNEFSENKDAIINTFMNLNDKPSKTDLLASVIPAVDSGALDLHDIEKIKKYYVK